MPRMKILVIGSGGREHALVWKLAQSPHVAKIWCTPGNAGIAAERVLKTGAPVECLPVAADDLPAMLAAAGQIAADLTVVGPDNPLAMGIVDLFTENRLRAWGPNRRAARFESSKAFSQEFMQKYDIPTARSGTFSEPEAALRFAETLDGRCAVKADGLALGKGVLLCEDPRQARRAIQSILVDKAFGAAGEKVVIQEFLEGIEVSLHAICDGHTARLFPSSQDHKRALDGDQGLNTGGMGTYSPAPFLKEEQWPEVESKIIGRWLRGCMAEGIDYRGIIYPGLMLTKSGPKVLEFNARFGDPETQVYLPRLEDDLVEVIEASMSGTLSKRELNWSPAPAVCVVMASGGYPGQYAKGHPIRGLEEAARLPNTKVFHAGTAGAGGSVVTSGGRVLGVTAWAGDLRSARDAAYRAVGKIHFEGAQFRRDIAAKALCQGPPACLSS
jgi:phosphoribosylamine---glycine ligase